MTAAMPRFANTLRRSFTGAWNLLGIAAAIGAASWGVTAVVLGVTDMSVMPTLAPNPVVMPGGNTLYVQKYEVTVAEWNRSHAAGACTLALRVTANSDAGAMPATGLSYMDVSQYRDWINTTTGHTYRLPTLHEWEYMAAEVLPKAPDPIFSDPDLKWASTYLTTPQTKRTLRVQGAFATTTQGITDLNGSVWE